MSASFDYSCIAFEGGCPATQLITPPVNGLVAADSTEPPGWLPAQMVWSTVSILSCRTGHQRERLTRLPMRQLSIHASVNSPQPPNFTPGVTLLGQLARAAAAQLHLGLQDSLASCKSASTALVAMPTSAITADPGSAGQAKQEAACKPRGKLWQRCALRVKRNLPRYKMTMITPSGCCTTCSLTKGLYKASTSCMYVSD